MEKYCTLKEYVVPSIMGMVISSLTWYGAHQLGVSSWGSAGIAAVTTVGIIVTLMGRKHRESLALIEAEMDFEKLAQGNYQSSRSRLAQWVLARAAELAQKIRGVTAATARVIDENSVSLARISFEMQGAVKTIDTMLGHAGTVMEAATNIRTTSESMSSNADKAAQIASAAEEKSAASKQAITEAIDNMSTMRTRVREVSEIADGLNGKSEQIKRIAIIVKEIADQTNLLALNAAIEAARAGEAGRGFAVVADEVRKLAERTASATAEITGTASSIGEDTRQAAVGMLDVSASIEEGVKEMNLVGADYVAILGQIHEVTNIIHGVSEQAEENRLQINQVTEYISELNGKTGEAAGLMKRVSTQVLDLAGIGEQLHESLSEVNSDSEHMRIYAIGCQAANSIASILEEAMRSGQLGETAVFDTSYRQIPNTNPPKFKTAYDDFSDRRFPEVQEPILTANPDIVYAGAVDVNGYFPTHNRKFSQPLTGDYEKDLANSRTKRIFNDRTGLRCGQNTRKFLLQTYMRDTGEVMHDLSVPIMVRGRHWGGFRIGYRSK